MILLFFFIDYASERNESLLSDYRAQLILCKDYASERNESLLSNCRAQLILCKITLFFRKMQEIYGKMFESEEDKTTMPTFGTVSNHGWAMSLMNDE